MLTMISLLFTLLQLFYMVCYGALPREGIPPIQFDIFHIKTPQLIGIICGCIVFTVTIAVVIYLLFASGTIKGFLEEMRADPSSHLSLKVKSLPQVEELPRLYDYLLEASMNLPSIPTIPKLYGKAVTIKMIDLKDSQEILHLFEASNGSPQYHESAYDPLRLWGWIEKPKSKLKSQLVSKVIENFSSTSIYESKEGFVKYLESLDEISSHVVIIDNEMQKPIGMITLRDNFVSDLTIRLGSIWITPAYQGKKRGHESILLLLQSLFQLGYRRITIETDVRNIVSRKFIERCGFLLECVLRKHKIADQRNRDTALYVLLNSEWEEKEIKLKKYLGWETRIKGVNVFAIPNPADVIKPMTIKSTDQGGQEQTTESENKTEDSTTQQNNNNNNNDDEKKTK